MLSLEDIPYDIKFELSLFKSKSKTSLSDIVFYRPILSEVKSLSELDLSSLKDWFFEEIKPESDLDIKEWIKFYHPEQVFVTSKPQTQSTSVYSSAPSTSSYIPTTSIPITSTPLPTQPIPSVVNPVYHPAGIMAHFGPLVLPGNLADLPQGYGQRIPLFYENSEIIECQHIAKITTFIYLEELDANDAKM